MYTVQLSDSHFISNCLKAFKVRLSPSKNVVLFPLVKAL